MPNRKHQSIKVQIKVSAIQNGQATLMADEIGELKWPTDKLPENVQEGDQLTLNLCAEKSCNEMEHLRALLEELLH